MELSEALFTRRSIRKYTDKPVGKELVKELLRAAMIAPSAGNQQPWHFVVIDDRKLLNEIPDFHPHAAMLKDAPLAILVCGDKGKEKHPGYFQQDCSAAVQNLLLAAHDKGLGAVWLGVYPREARIEGFKKMFNTPSGVVPFACVSIGWPDQKSSYVDRYDEGNVHWNKW